MLQPEATVSPVSKLASEMQHKSWLSEASGDLSDSPAGENACQHLMSTGRDILQVWLTVINLALQVEQLLHAFPMTRKQ